MKKLSLFSLLGLTGLLAFVATPIYAQEENLVADDGEIVATTEDIVLNDEFDYGIDEEGIALEAVEEDTVEDLDNWSNYFGDEDWETASFDWLSSWHENISWDILARVLWLWFFAVIMGYCFFLYQCLMPISQREIYRKAGKKGWAWLVPFWGTMVYSEIAWMNKWWWICPWLLAIIPLFAMSALMWWLGNEIRWILWIITFVLWIITFIWLIVANYRVARRYGWGVFCSILHVLFYPITVLILGLGNYKYQGKEENTVVEA